MPASPDPLSPERSAERALLHVGGLLSGWHNFGLWPAPDYATACEALARAVGDAAELKRGQRVLSVGSGTGEELALWQAAYGCTEAVGTDAAQPSENHQPVDAIVCVDAAYHFSPREAWLRACAQKLRPGGRIAYTDLTLDISSSVPKPLRAVLRLAFAAAGIAMTDLVPQAQALGRLRAAGFKDAQATALGAAVLDGFCAFASQQRQHLPRGWAAQRAWLRVRITAAALRGFRRWPALGLGYSLISACWPETAACSAVTADRAELTADSNSGTPSAA